MICKKCNHDQFREEMRNTALTVWCMNCGAYVMNKKYTENPKSKDEYRNEYMDKQPATDNQMTYIKKLIKDGISKFKASEIISILKGDACE